MKQPKFSNETRKHLARTVVSAAINGEKLTVQKVKQPKRKRVRETFITYLDYEGLLGDKGRLPDLVLSRIRGGSRVRVTVELLPKRGKP